MIEILVGVQVVDEAGYTTYREHMLPLLAAHGGAFCLDVRVAEVLRSPQTQAFNRLFTLRFPSEQQLEAFFSHPEYLSVRARYFDNSVAATTRFGRYQVL